MINEELATKVAQAASAALLRIAKYYHEQGMFHQAVSPYLKIIAYYPDSEATPAAVDGLVTIAGVFEGKQQLRMAMSVYDRLERAARFRRWDGHAVSPEGDIV